MQYRVLDRRTLDFVDSGAVVAYEIRNDYYITKNSVINLVEPTKAKVGDLIALIKTEGAYSLGCVGAVDNKGLTISYQDGKEFFAGKQLNPLRYFYTEDKKLTVKFDAVEGTAALIKGFFVNPKDTLQKLPLEVVISGSVMTIWRDEENDFDFKNYLLNIFDNINIVLQFGVVFGAERKIRVRIFANNNTGENIKDNIKLMTLTDSEEQQPESTVCHVLSAETKDIIATYYLRENDTITTQSDLLYNGSYRILPPKITTEELSADDIEKGITAYDVALEALRGNVFNHIITAKIDKNSQMIDINRLQIGDGIKIITEEGETNTVFTGIEESNTSNMVILTFGKGRKNYTDKIQLALRRVYN